MTVSEGESLTLYINNNSERFKSDVLDLDSQCLVFIVDTQTQREDGRFHAYQPILHFESYMIGARTNKELFADEFPPADCVRLLEGWEREQRNSRSS